MGQQFIVIGGEGTVQQFIVPGGGGGGYSSLYRGEVSSSWSEGRGTGQQFIAWGMDQQFMI